MRSKYLVLALTLLLLGACASSRPENKQGQKASVIDFLFPDRESSAQVQLATLAEIKVPFRVGLAFVSPRPRDRNHSTACAGNSQNTLSSV